MNTENVVRHVEKVAETIEKVDTQSKELIQKVRTVIKGALRIATIISFVGIILGIVSLIGGGGIVYFAGPVWVDIFGWSIALLGIPMIIVGVGIFFLKSQIEENIEHVSNVRRLLTGTNVLQTLLGLMISFSFLRTLPMLALVSIAYTIYAVIKIRKAKEALKVL